MFGAGGALLEREHGVSGVIVEIDFAMLTRDLDRAAHAVDGDIAAPRNDDQIGVLRDVNIEVGDHTLLAGGVSVGVERDDLARNRDLRLGLSVGAVGVGLFF